MFNTTLGPIESATTRELAERWIDVCILPEEKACDNMSDALCCDYCGANELREQLVLRAVDLTDIERYIRHYTRGLMTGREFREYIFEELDKL